MKSKFLKKARVASAVTLATAAMAAGTVQADSLLAPLILNDTNTTTYLSLRTGQIIAPVNGLHYTWLQKNSTLNGTNNTQIALGDMNRKCIPVNSFGKATPLDMVYQTTKGNANFMTPPIAPDFSMGSGFPWAPGFDYAGMLVIDIDAALGIEEGNFLGFAYVVDTANNFLLDYKLLNNHLSTKSGDFSAGFISKKSIDFSWLPDTFADTYWYTAVVSDDMTKGPEQAGVYDATVNIQSQPRVELDGTANQESPQAIQGGIGVYNNDEDYLSGARDKRVTCVAYYQRDAFILPSQFGFTANGGWTRRAIQPVDTVIDATGAITYKMERSNNGGVFPGVPAASWQIETSGHLSTQNGTKANRPN